ncbi:MAG: NfeD family protein [Candidatus Omnitrophota bacterium]
MWVLWILAGVIVLIGEILTPGFVLGCFAVGCFGAGAAAKFTDSMTLQLTAFIASTLLGFFAVRPLFLHFLYGASSDVKTNVDALAGRRGFVIEPIDPRENKGRVKVGGEDWRGVSIDDSSMEKGTEIVVRRVEGTKLIVERIQKPYGSKTK